MYKIEKAPEINPRERFPFSALKPGESFFAPLEKSGSLRASAALYGQRHGCKFSCRIDHQRGGIHCIRIE